jgi:hypothetical protein
MLFMTNMISAIMAMFVDPLFHSFYPLTIINISTTSKFVVKSITTKIDQLISTFILVFFVINFYAFVIGQYYYDNFDSGSTNDVFYCKSLASCYL